MPIAHIFLSSTHTPVKGGLVLAWMPIWYRHSMIVSSNFLRYLWTVKFLLVSDIMG